MRSHPHAEEKAPEHPELHTCSAQERALETTGPSGKILPTHFVPQTLTCAQPTQWHSDLTSLWLKFKQAYLKLLLKAPSHLSSYPYSFICTRCADSVCDSPSAHVFTAHTLRSPAGFLNKYFHLDLASILPLSVQQISYFYCLPHCWHSSKPFTNVPVAEPPSEENLCATKVDFFFFFLDSGNSKLWGVKVRNKLI